MAIDKLEQYASDLKVVDDGLGAIDKYKYTD